MFTPTGHLFYRTDKLLGGAFVGVETASHVTAVGGGFEGQYYLDPKWTLDGAIGYAGVTNSDLHIFGTRLGARYFVTDNFSLGGKVDYARLTENGFGEDLWTFGVKGEYQLTQLPVSLSLAYERGELHNTPLHSDTLKVGVKWSFGGGSLHDRDRHGASLDSVSDTFGGEIGKTLIGANSSIIGSNLP